jgi:hypothetical protein
MMTLRVLLAVVIAFVLLQFVPRRNRNEVVNEAEIFNPDRSVPEMALVRSACFDCHSNETEYPWYYFVQPLSLWLDHHVEEGREELNFSTWHVLPLDEQARRLEDCAEMLEKKEMPLTSFTLTHPEARLSDEERLLLTDWFKRLRSEH